MEKIQIDKGKDKKHTGKLISNPEDRTPYTTLTRAGLAVRVINVPVTGHRAGHTLAPLMSLQR